jgi:hypothetical protein
VPKLTRAAKRSPGRGISKLAEQLIIEHPDWIYRRIAEEEDGRIDGAKATEKSVRWYAGQARRNGRMDKDRRPSRYGHGQRRLS